ncbi:hypothetical protein GCM10022227_06980 [Streptomyces sedi]
MTLEAVVLRDACRPNPVGGVRRTRFTGHVPPLRRVVFCRHRLLRKIAADIVARAGPGRRPRADVGPVTDPPGESSALDTLPGLVQAPVNWSKPLVYTTIATAVPRHHHVDGFRH